MRGMICLVAGSIACLAVGLWLSPATIIALSIEAANSLHGGEGLPNCNNLTCDINADCQAHYPDGCASKTNQAECEAYSWEDLLISSLACSRAATNTYCTAQQNVLCRIVYPCRFDWAMGICVNDTSVGTEPFYGGYCHSTTLCVIPAPTSP